MKKVFDKVFSNKKVFIPLFSAIMAFELAIIIATVAQKFSKIHWLNFYCAIVLIGLLIALFILNLKKKKTACKWLVSITLFIQACITAAYSFVNYPKAPGYSFAPFVLYLIYGCLLLALFFAALVLHTNLNKKRNDQTVFAMQIMGCIFALLTLADVIYIFVFMGKYGYSNALLVDLFCYISYGLITTFIIFAESQYLPLYNKELEHKTK